MTPVQALLEKLPGARKAGSNWSARCPAHEDKRASLSIAEGDDGRALVKCHAGCDTAAIVAAIGMNMADLFPRNPGPTPIRNERPTARRKNFGTSRQAVTELDRRHGKKSALWTYYNGAGEPVGLVVRWDGRDGKDIRPVALYGRDWRIAAMPDPRPLYGLPNLADAARVVVTEGEKAADAARKLGFTATTSAGGSQAPEKSDWRPLAGKEVWILPDNDAPGRKYAETVAGILAKLAPAPVVRIVELPGLPKKGDIVDWIDAHGDAAEPVGMREEVEALAEADGMREEVEALAEAEAPDPSAESLDYRPFPVEVLPETLRGFVVAGATALGCDMAMLALPLLAAAGAAIGNTRRLRLKQSWFVPPILWTAVVGESGSLKTPAFKLVMKPLRQRQEGEIAKHKMESREFNDRYAIFERDRDAWKRSRGDGEPPEEPQPPVAVRYIVSDTTMEALAPILSVNPRGLLMARDELAGWLGSFDRYSNGKAGSDAANWLSLYNAETIVIDRKTGISRTIHVPHAAVSITGGIQPGILRRALAPEHRESGLAARLLLAYPPRKAKVWTETDIAPEVEDSLQRLFDRLLSLQFEPNDDPESQPKPIPVKLSRDAEATWVAYYNAHAQEQADLTGDLSAAWSKLEEAAARLALVVHFAKWGSGAADEAILDKASMESGIALAGWFKHEARRVYVMLDGSDAEGVQRRLLEWIARRGGPVTAREVRQSCRWLKEPGAAESALEDLAKAGRGNWISEPPPATGGHSRRVFAPSTPSTSTLARKTREIQPSVDSRRCRRLQRRSPEDDPEPSHFDSSPSDPENLNRAHRNGRLFDSPDRLPD